MYLQVREAVEQDAEDIARLSSQLGYIISAADTLHNLKVIHEDKNGIVWVAVQENEVVGWIHVFQNTRVESGSFCEIGGLVVDNRHMRKGFGKILVMHAKEWTKNRGFPELRVRCNVKRAATHKFYQDIGFMENKQQKVFTIDLLS